jgi:hypothetical protein
VIIVVAGTVAKWKPAPEPNALRGAAHVVLTLETPQTLSDGTLALRWESVPDADAYQVVLLRDDLSEVARMPTTDRRESMLDKGSLPADATHWQVIALLEGAVAAESTPEALPR